MDEYWIPRNLNAPALLFMWEADTVMIFLVIFLLGIMLEMVLVSAVIAWLAVRTASKLKEEGGVGLLQRLLYWYMPSDWLTQKYPSHIREFVGE